MNFMEILKGIACGIIYVSAFFWAMVLTYIHNGIAFTFVLLLLVLANVIIGLLLASESHRYAIYKWLISLPVGIITFFIYRQTNFLYDWLNRITPGYGNLTPGGGFAFLFFMVLYLMSFFIAVTISVYITNQKMTTRHINGDCHH